ncbi:MAG TPA: hypothetical protein VKF79_08820, partial [Candidatus Acidoferrum sp.]|nr:hypothetical protein [Candidatus Acidoferrum sp.]
TALIHMDAKQKQRLTRRAKLRGKSFSQEVRDAVDLYLDVPVETQEELQTLAAEANRAADRMIKRLDITIARVDRVLQAMKSAR